MRNPLNLIAVSLLVTTSACSVSPVAPVRETEYAPPGLINGTRILAEVGFAYERQEIVQPKSDWSHIDSWRETLLSVGFSDADIKDGSEIGATTFLYGHNSVAWNRHRGAYIAHVLPNLQGKLMFIVENHQKVRERGDLVEIELRESPSKRLVGIVVAIYRPYNDWGTCRWEHLDTSSIYALSPYGPPVGLWIDCDDLEQQGWRKQPVSGAPWGSTDKVVHEWVKVPTTQPK